MITIKTGNIFTSQCQTIVNTINCVGVMGAGIAYEFKLRYPEMFNKYQHFCQQGQIQIGSLWIYTDVERHYQFEKILNFPTKQHWKAPSQFSYLEQGLAKFVSSYKQKGVQSIAFPLLGASKGGLDEAQVIKLMEHYLSQCDIPVEIWHFDPSATDDLYLEFKQQLAHASIAEIKQKTGVRADIIEKIVSAMAQPHINSMSGLSGVKGVGKSSLEKLFNSLKQHTPHTRDMFD